MDDDGQLKGIISLNGNIEEEISKIMKAKTDNVFEVTYESERKEVLNLLKINSLLQQ